MATMNSPQRRVDHLNGLTPLSLLLHDERAVVGCESERVMMANENSAKDLGQRTELSSFPLCVATEWGLIKALGATGLVGSIQALYLAILIAFYDHLT